MDVLALTILCSLVLVAGFVALFLASRHSERFGSPERSSLLPLEDEELPEPK